MRRYHKGVAWRFSHAKAIRGYEMTEIQIARILGVTRGYVSHLLLSGLRKLARPNRTRMIS